MLLSTLLQFCIDIVMQVKLSVVVVVVAVVVVLLLDICPRAFIG